MSKRKAILSALFLIFAVGILIWLSINIMKKPLEFQDKNGRIWEEQEPIVKEVVYVPTEEDFSKLVEAYDKVLSYLEQKDLAIDVIREIYDKVCEAKVCSKANRNFNLLEEEYEKYQTQLEEIQKYISEFKEAYNEYERLLGELPSYARSLRAEKKAEFEGLKAQHETILSEEARYHSDDEAAYDMYLKAKKRAEDFFEEYYELMCKLVNAEIGGGSDEEQFDCANVVENRVEHPKFKYYTLYDVVYAPLQYECTWNGGIDKTPTNRVRKNMEKYLRGHVETGMPLEVTYQAKFKQGSGIYKYYEDSGHYYCYH